MSVRSLETHSGATWHREEFWPVCDRAPRPITCRRPIGVPRPERRGRDGHQDLPAHGDDASGWAVTTGWFVCFSTGAATGSAQCTHTRLDSPERTTIVLPVQK